MNLTDGLDGLAAGTGIIALFTFTAMAVDRLHPLGRARRTATEPTLDLAILGAALIGAAIGFLWYNAFPAEVFMGDTGSMALGGALAAFAIMTQDRVPAAPDRRHLRDRGALGDHPGRHFKYFGRRVFLMAPIHHHFEMKAWSETKIMVRFWIVAAILCAGGFALYYRYFSEFRA